MTPESVIAILGTGWLATIGWGVAWVVTVPAMKQELKELRKSVDEIKAKVHDSPCQASLIFQADSRSVMARYDERIKNIEHSTNP